MKIFNFNSIYWIFFNSSIFVNFGVVNVCCTNEGEAENAANPESCLVSLESFQRISPKSKYFVTKAMFYSEQLGRVCNKDGLELGRINTIQENLEVTNYIIENSFYDNGLWINVFAKYGNISNPGMVHSDGSPITFSRFYEGRPRQNSEVGWVYNPSMIFSLYKREPVQRLPCMVNYHG